MKNFPCTLMKAGRVKCRFNFMFPNTFLERVLLKQVNRTYSHSWNKLPENYSLSVHCPLMNQLWATHEFLFFEPAIQKDSKTIDIGRISDLLILEPAETAPDTHSWSTHALLMNHSWNTHGHRSCGQKLPKNMGFWSGYCLEFGQHGIENAVTPNAQWWIYSLSTHEPLMIYSRETTKLGGNAPDCCRS